MISVIPYHSVYLVTGEDNTAAGGRLQVPSRDNAWTVPVTQPARRHLAAEELGLGHTGLSCLPMPGPGARRTASLSPTLVTRSSTVASIMSPAIWCRLNYCRCQGTSQSTMHNL